MTQLITFEDLNNYLQTRMTEPDKFEDVNEHREFTDRNEIT